MKKIIIVMAMLFTVFSVKSQTAINRLNSHSSYYDFIDQYFSNPNYRPSNQEGGTDKYIEKTFKLWGKSLHPSGDFSVAANAITDYAKGYSYKASSYNPNWKSLGPNEDPYSTQSGVGQMHRLAFDPYYDGATNQTIYAGSGFGGLWKTIDNGLNWTSMNTDVQLPIASVSGIAINPSNTSNIFISTGDGDGGFGLQFSNNHGFPNPVATTGVYRTTDDGQTWEPINNGLLSNFAKSGIIRQLRMNPSDPNEIVLASSSGVIKTNNATAPFPTWSIEFTGIGGTIDQQFRGIEYKPGDPSTLYASGTDIYKLEGSIWSSMTGSGTGLDFNAMPNSFTPGRINIAVTPADPSMLYAYIYGSEANNLERIYIYVFENDQWSMIFTETEYDAWHLKSINWQSIAVSPVNPYEYYFGFTYVYGTSDYRTIPEGDVSGYTTSGFHADVHALKFTPNMSNPDLFAGTHGGINYLPTPSNPNPRSRWERRYKGLGTSLIWTFDNSEFDSRKIIGKQDLGISIFKPTTNEWTTITGGDGYATRIDDESPDEVYFNGNFPFQKYNFFSGSIYTWEDNKLPIDHYDQIKTTTHQIFPMVNHPQTGELWFGFSELYKRKKREIVSGDLNTDIWEVQSGNHAIPNHRSRWQRGISELVIAESNPNYIYIATTGVDNSFNGPESSWKLNPLLLRSTTGGSNGDPTGTNFTNITANLPNMYSGATDYPVITGIAVNPSDEKELWVTFAGYDPTRKVWHSTDAGNSWSNYDLNGSLPNLSMNVIAYQDGTDDVLFVGTDVGVYIKEGKLNDWKKYGDFPNVRVTEMQINYCAGKLDVATYGRGMWEGDIMPYTGYSSAGRLLNNNDVLTDIYITKNLTVAGSSSIIVNGSLNVVPKAKIHVETGSYLNIDGNKINYCNESCSDLHFEIAGTLTVNDGLILHEKSSININSTGIVNIVDAQGLCINPNTTINIVPGGKLYLNGIDYTNIISNGYNNVYNKTFFSQHVDLGNHYAFNEIRTSSSVNTLPHFPTNLIAGRKIVFTTGFSAGPGLNASIDPYINNCHETPCMGQGSNLRKVNTGVGLSSTSFIKEGMDNIIPEKQLVNIYPNPNNGQFNIELNNDEEGLVEVYDVMGKQVFSKNNVRGKMSIDLKDQTKGIYFVRVTIGDQVVNEKVVYQ